MSIETVFVPPKESPRIREFFFKSVLFCAIFIFVASIRFPDANIPSDPGSAAPIGLSRAFGLNVYQKHGLEFGRNLISGYGPLGFLAEPLALGDEVLWSRIAGIAVYLGAGAAIAIAASNGGNYAGWLAGLGLLFLFAVPGELGRSVIPFLSIVIYADDLSRRRGLFFLIPVFFSAAWTFVEFEAGFALTLMYGVYLGFCVFQKRESGKTLALKTSAYLIVGAVLAILNFRSFESFLKWLGGAVVIMADLAESHGIAGRDEEAILGFFLAFLAVPAAMAIAGSRGRIRALFWLTEAGIAIYFSLRNGLINPIEPQLLRFFSSMPILFASALAFVPLRRIVVVLYLVSVLATQGTAWRFDALHPFARLKEVNFEGLRSIAGIHREYGPNHWKLLKYALSKTEFDKMRHQSVNVVPFEVVCLDDGPVKWRPAPIFQFQEGISKRLDDWNRAHIEGDRAAEYVVMKFQGNYGMHPFYTAPQSFLAILGRYRFAFQEASDRIILKKSKAGAPVKRFLKAVNAKWGEWVEIPASDTMVLAEFRTEYSLFGWIIKTFYRAPTTVVTLQRPDGAEDTFRFSPATAAAGIIVNRPPLDLAQARTLFEKRRVDESFAVFGHMRADIVSKPVCFAEKFRVSFYELRLGPEPAEAS